MKNHLRAFGVAGLVSLALLLGPAPAEAGHGHHKKSHPHHWKQGRGHRPVFVVPSYIPARHVVEYQPYFVARSWYRPHRHRHVVYRFPVYTDFGMVYRPYTYCGDHVFYGDGFRGYDDDVHGRVAVAGPNFGLSIGW